MTTSTQVQEGPKEKTTAIKTTETVKRARGMVKGIYRRGLEAEAEGRPRAYTWGNSGYNEILQVMGITPIPIENYAGLCAAKRAATPYLAKADSEGFAGAICTYLTNALGFDALRTELGHMPPDAPDGGLATPSMMLGIGLGLICDPRHKLFQTLQRYHPDVPVYVFNAAHPTPDVNLKEVQDYYIKYNVTEFKGLVEFLEKQTGKKLDWDKLSEAINRSEETYRLQAEIQQIRKAIPSPMPTQDNWNCMVPNNFLLGTQEALDFYRDLRDEVKYRAEHKMGVIPEEKYRIMWGGGLPPWHTMRIFNYFETLGAVVCCEGAAQCLDWLEPPPGVTHPLERLAWRMFKMRTSDYEKAQNHTGDPNVEDLLEGIEEYKVDGVVMHRVFSCRTLHVGLIHRLRMLKQFTDIPQLLLEGDIIDPNLFPEADSQAKVRAFIEVVDNHKKSKRQN